MFQSVQSFTNTDKLSAAYALDSICFPGPQHQPLKAYMEADYGQNTEVLLHQTQSYPIILNPLYASNGYITFNQPWLPKVTDFYIPRIGVHPGYRRRGFAYNLLHAALHTIACRTELKKYTVFADIHAENCASRALFQKAGFTDYYAEDYTYTTLGEIGIRVGLRINLQDTIEGVL